MKTSGKKQAFADVIFFVKGTFYKKIYFKTPAVHKVLWIYSKSLYGYYMGIIYQLMMNKVKKQPFTKAPVHGTFMNFTVELYNCIYILVNDE